MTTKKTDLGYKVEGVFDPDTKKIYLNAYILPGSDYIDSPVYNLTKKTPSKTINAIVIFLRKTITDPGLSVGSQVLNTDFPMEYWPNTLATTGNSTNVDFDFDNDDSLVILFHDNDNNIQKDIKELYNKIGFYHTAASANPDHFILVTLPNKGILQPRKVGMSIIPKGIKP